MHRRTLARNCLPPASPNCPAAPNSIAPAPRSDPETPPPSRPESPAPAAPPQPPQPSPVESHSKSSFLAPDHPPHPPTHRIPKKSCTLKNSRTSKKRLSRAARHNNSPLAPGSRALDVQPNVHQHLLRGLQSRIHRFAFQRQHAKHTLVHSAQRLTSNKPFQRLNPQRKFAQCQRPLGRHVATPQPAQIFRQQIFGAVNNSQIFAASALDRRLHQPPPPMRDEIERLHHHAFAAAAR